MPFDESGMGDEPREIMENPFENLLIREVPKDFFLDLVRNTPVNQHILPESTGLKKEIKKRRYPSWVYVNTIEYYMGGSEIIRRVLARVKQIQNHFSVKPSEKFADLLEQENFRVFQFRDLEDINYLEINISREKLVEKNIQYMVSFDLEGGLNFESTSDLNFGDLKLCMRQLGSAIHQEGEVLPKQVSKVWFLVYEAETEVSKF